MNKLILAAIASLFAVNVAFAADAKPAAAPAPAPAAAPAAAPAGDCDAQAVGKNGKSLAGAAKAAFMKKCEGAGKPAEANAASGCEEKAIGKNGKPLAGAAKGAFMKKCENDAKAAK